MSRTGKGKGPLRADRRYPASTATRKRSTAAKTGKSPAVKSSAKTAAKRVRKPARRTKRSGGGGFFGPIRALFRWILRLIWSIGWRVGAVLGVVVAGAVAFVYNTLPDATALIDGRARGSVTMMDDTGEVFAWRGDQFGGMITTDTVSPHLKNAIISTEDRRFYSHFGVSPRGVASAIRINLTEGRSALSGHGGSTITQQTAKLLCLGTPYDPSEWKSETEYEADCRRGSLARKIREAIYALAMEARYTKDEILTIYMNRAYLGAGARGFQAAAQRYFGKSAAEVNPAEAAMLAGLLVAPTRYAPTSNLERSQERASLIIGLMEQEDYLTAAEATQARNAPAQLSEAAEARAGGYFADWVMESVPSFLASETTEDVLIRTTFDSRLQRAAEGAMQTVFAEKVREGSKAQAAIVVMSADGAVRAMVGGRKTRVSGQFNRATQALRQTGSAFKPFIYAAALDLGYSPNSIVVDEPMTLNVPGSGPWSPQNYTRKFAGRVTLTEALADSLNIPAVKVSEAVGRDAVIAVATGFGISTKIDNVPAMALGTSETTLLQMTAAYAGILNGGSSVTPYGLTELKLLGDESALIGQDGGIGERVVSQSAARQLVWMMHEVIESGTGRRAKLDGRPAAGKTGTTSAARDAWFVGFTGEYVVGVWMGYDDNTPLTGTTGGGLPADIWRETMVRVNDGLPVTPLPMDPPSNGSDNRLAGGGSSDGQPSNGTSAPLEDFGNTGDRIVRDTERAITNVLKSLFGG
ncbi:transglycosylase domain-containing protein [Meridianimarinicoccus aquatilis]|uniref:peptidoglycan glycosyltransferase n=1 Tax=Meridianimarinicoccus aquatilis TaxID=2552766 RepID=A0A4R6AS83_9RHOB|nr:PBP1A family penicillin-binding protein [Fluviibacterium aquatile]TDL86990.1 PBP1A family penicillin-binding protein [Fluviibacterium aquatile]